MSQVRSPYKRAWQLVLWISLAALAWVLGTCGYVQANYSVWDAPYLALQLFTLQGPDVKCVPTTLYFARWFAAALAGYAVLQAAAVLFADRFQSLRLVRTREHVVIVGLGRKGRQFIHAFRRRGANRQTVVVIEKDRNSPYIGEARELGAMVIFGDAAEPGVLAKANLRHASKLLCLADDMTNLKLAARIELLVGPLRTTRNPLTCHLHLGDPVIVRNLRPIELRPSEGGLRQRVLSLHEIAAPKMLALGVELNSANGPTTLVVIGLDAMGEALLLEAISQWRLSGTGHPQPLTVIAVDERATKKMEGILTRFPTLTQFSAVKAIDWDADTPLMDRCEFAFDEQCGHDIRAVFVCLPDEQKSLRTALHLGHRCHETGHKFPIVLQLASNPQLGTLFAIPNIGPAIQHVRVFSMFDETCRPEHLLGVAERIAQTIHQFYLWERQRQGQELRSRPALRPWEELEPRFRESNLNQVEHMPDIVAACNYRIIRLQSPDAEKFVFPPGDLEELAKLEHGRYQRYRVASDPQTLETSWNQLSEDDKLYTRNQVAKWPQMLALRGFEVLKMVVPDGQPANITTTAT